MASQAILSSVIKAIDDAQRCQSGSVEGHRVVDVANRQKYVIQHMVLLLFGQMM
jgi:hypothetical protein